jgi:hypothetical protein
MPPRKKPRKKVKSSTRKGKEHPHLPGYLMIAFGLMGLSLNYDLLSGLEWAKPYPLLGVLFGFVFMIKTFLARD